MAASIGYRAIEAVSRMLPINAGYGASKAVAAVMWRLCPAARERVRQNLAGLLGGSPAQFDEASKEVFCNFGYYLFELFAMHRVEKLSIATEGLEFLEAARKANRGVIMMTAHVGNWELGARAFQSLGYATSAVALPHANAGLDALFNRHRLRAGVEVIPLDHNAMRASLKALAAGRLLGLLADRDFTGDGIPVAIGKGKMLIPKGPAVLSLRSRAPIVPVILVREGNWQFRLICMQALWPEAGKPERQSVEALVCAYAAILEAMIKRYARQWLMFEPLFITA